MELHCLHLLVLNDSSVNVFLQMYNLSQYLHTIASTSIGILCDKRVWRLIREG